MKRLDRAGNAAALALRLLPAAGDPGYPSPGEIAAGLATKQSLTGPRFERAVEHLHRLGPRPVGELLIEIAHATNQSSLVMDRLRAFGVLDVETVRLVGANHFPPHVLEIVQ